jgi:hypothetical protein
MPTTPEKEALHDRAAAARGALRGDARRAATAALTARAAERLAGEAGLIGHVVPTSRTTCRSTKSRRNGS